MSRLSTLSRSVTGSNVIITGAASGMGRATAFLFADAGARVALVDINEAGLEDTAAVIRECGAEAFTFAADCSEREAVEAAVTGLAETMGGLDILINNAGVVLGSDLNDPGQYESSWETSMAVMASAQQWAVRVALPWLRSAEHPRIINIASTEGLGATAFNSAYVAAKHASVGLTRALAVDLGKEGITVNCVCPGPVNTGMTSVIPDEDKAIFARRRTALRRYGEPEEIAQVILSLALPAASFVTGAVIPVDGGLTIRNA